jgi:hypothetical protein
MRRAAWLLTLVGAVTTATPACSSKARRDQNYGSNVGADYHAPEAGPLPVADTATAADRPDAAADAAADAAPRSTDALAETAGRD